METEVNNGVTNTLELDQNGRLKMISGTDKVDASLDMFVNFINGFRIFTQDYVLNPNMFIQNTSNQLRQYKANFRLNAMNISERYIPYVDFYAIDIVGQITNRRDYVLYIQYRYTLPQSQNTNLVTIKKVLT